VAETMAKTAETVPGTVAQVNINKVIMCLVNLLSFFVCKIRKSSERSFTPGAK